MERIVSSNDGAVLGMAFKADIDDLRQSPAMRISELLVRDGAIVAAHDPFHDTPSVDTVLTDADAVVLATNHTAFRQLKVSELRTKTKPDCIFVDCWGQWIQAEPDEDIVTFGRVKVS